MGKSNLASSRSDNGLVWGVADTIGADGSNPPPYLRGGQKAAQLAGLQDSNHRGRWAYIADFDMDGYGTCHRYPAWYLINSGAL